MGSDTRICWKCDKVLPNKVYPYCLNPTELVPERPKRRKAVANKGVTAQPSPSLSNEPRPAHAIIVELHRESKTSENTYCLIRFPNGETTKAITKTVAEQKCRRWFDAYQITDRVIEIHNMVEMCGQ